MSDAVENTCILIVDPDDICRRIVAQRLSTAGYRIFQAPDGTAAMTSLNACIPRVIITEINMPGIDGMQLCRQLKERTATARIPVIILSSKQMVGDKIAALDAGARDYVTKPFSLSELEARVRAALRE